MTTKNRGEQEGGQDGEKIQAKNAQAAPSSQNKDKQGQGQKRPETQSGQNKQQGSQSKDAKGQVKNR